MKFNRHHFIALNEHIYKINKDGKDGILHLQDMYSPRQIEKAKTLLDNTEFIPQEHEGTIARYEAFHIPIKNSCIGVIYDLLKLIHLEMGFNRQLSFETYAFKYNVGHEVPKHKDKDRHKITAIAYFGNFTGGAYLYWTGKNEDCISINPNEGDIILSINETNDGRVLNPVHCVSKVTSGSRLSLVGSLVSSVK